MNALSILLESGSVLLEGLVSDFFFFSRSVHIYIFTEGTSMDYIFYWTVGGEKKGTGGAAAYCHSDYVLLEGRRASGIQILFSLHLPSQNQVDFSNVHKTT